MEIMILCESYIYIQICITKHSFSESEDDICIVGTVEHSRSSFIQTNKN